MVGCQIVLMSSPSSSFVLDESQIQRFISITGASYSDASRFLQITQNNFELAIDLYTDSSSNQLLPQQQQQQETVLPASTERIGEQYDNNLFQDSLQNAQLLDKLVLVFLRDQSNNQSVEFGAFVWNNPTVKELLVEAGFYLICLEVGENEGERFKLLYSVPQVVDWLFVIDPETGEELYKAPITLDSEAFVQNCSEFASSARHHRVVREEQEERAASRTNTFQNATEYIDDLDEEEQIERAIQESLEAGKESLERKNILKSCNFEGTFPNSTDPNAIKIQIRMPNGAKVVQAFYPTDPIMRIFQFVQQNFAQQIDSKRDFELYFEGKRLFEHRDKTINEFDLKNASLVFDYE